MHLQIPGLSDITHFTALLAHSLALSLTHNPRNLEFYWYPPWNRFLVDLVADTPNLIVYPQFPIWIPAHPEDESADTQTSPGDGSVDEEVPTAVLEEEERQEQVAESARAARLKARNEKKKAQDRSTPTAPLIPANPSADVARSPSEDTWNEQGVSAPVEEGEPPISAHTVHYSDAIGRVADFAIVNISATRKKGSAGLPEGWNVEEATIPLLVEVKRGPSRSLKGRQRSINIAVYLMRARNDLLKQAAFLFASHPEWQEIRAIAAAGPYWNIARFERDVHFREEDFEALQVDPDYNYRPQELPELPEPNWSTTYKMYSISSFRRLQGLRTWMKKQGVMEAPKMPDIK